MRLERWQELAWAPTPEGAREPLAGALTFRGSLVRWCAARGVRLRLRLRMQEARPADGAEAAALGIARGATVLARQASLLWGGRVAVEAWSWIVADALPVALLDALARGEAPLGELWRTYGLGFVRRSPEYARVPFAPWERCWARRSMLVADEAPTRALIVEVFTPRLARALHTAHPASRAL